MAEPPIADAAQRRRALETGESFIVQAPAGSGKTELLTQRYLRLLGQVTDPEEIYAITFTRKAANEMRNRILAALDAAAGTAPSAPHRRLTWQLARDALARDRAAGWRIADNPNRLRIQTFDSLSHALARQMPLLSHLGAPPATTERALPHYRDAARATLRMLEDSDLGADVARVLVHLDNRLGQLEELLCSMLARRDQWLPHVVASPDGDSLDASLEEAVAAHLADLRAACAPDWLHRLVAVAQQIADHPNAPFTPGDVDAIPGSDWQQLPVWQGLATLLLTAKGELRRSWNVKIGFDAPTGSRVDAGEKARRQARKAEIEALCGALQDQAAALELWRGARLLPSGGLDVQQHEVLRSLFLVLRLAAAELQLVFRQRGEVDFAEIQMCAQRALGSPSQPTDLALSLDYRLQHLLVDEFQDTSSSQYHLLETLTAGWQPGDGRTLFAVGDPMQSIYRFREAEVGLYLAAREHGIGALRLTPLTLSVNFRSTGSIVDWVNRSFPRIFPERLDVGRGAVPYAPATAFDRTADDHAVQVHPLAGNNPRPEADRVVELVAEALTGSADDTVAVLARARAHLADIALRLKAAGLAFRAVDVDPLSRQPVVRDLHALTRALLHPADRLSWLVVLRAPWLGLALKDLLMIAEASRRCIPARLHDPGVRAALSTDGRRRVERLLRLTDAVLPARGRRPLRPWIEGIWLALGGLALAGDAGAADAQAYLALLERFEQAAGVIDLGRLDEALGDLYAAPDSLADGRVQLMTMHKAKGLEFDTVILPGLGRGTRGSGNELIYWLERPGRDGGVQLLMAPIRARGQQVEPISGYLRELDKEKQRLETSRLLYVAATRARRRLHLIGHLGVSASGTLSATPTANSLLAQLWPVVGDAFAALTPPLPEPAANTAADAGALRRLPADWQPAPIAGQEPLATATDDCTAVATIEFDWASDAARHVGTLVHRHLERIATDGIDHWPTARVDALAPRVRLGLQHLGVDEAELDGAIDRAMRALRRTLEDETGRWILSAHAEARCEWPLTLSDAGSRHCVIDRSFVDKDGVRWIIDYKTGDHLDQDRDAFLDREQARYREQLETYAQVVRAQEDRPIRLALYFPLFAAWRVWDFEA